MKISKREGIMLMVVAVMLLSMAYYVLYFKDYLVERVSLKAEVQNQITAMGINSTKITALPNLRKQASQRPEAESLQVLEDVDTSEISYHLFQAVGSMADSMSLNLSPSAPIAGTAFVTLPVSVMATIDKAELSAFVAKIDGIAVSHRFTNMNVQVQQGELSLLENEAAEPKLSVSLELAFVCSPSLPLPDKKLPYPTKLPTDTIPFG